jgi:hypothetical protein
MRLIGSNGYDVVPSVSKNWRLIMNFMLSNGLSYKNSSDTMNEVHGQVYADLAVYQLSNFGIGPTKIVLSPTTQKSEYDIYMLFQPFGGQMFFKSDSPELTTFLGQQVTTGSLPWVITAGLSYMVVNKSEIYHQNDPPIENYTPTTITGGAYLFNNNNIFPIVGGSGISVSFVPEDVENNGYIQISSVSTSNVPSTPTPPVA